MRKVSEALERGQSGGSHGVGRPRDERIDREVVSAVLHALREGGYRAVTIEGIARRVGRARTSLYRRWPSKRNLVAYAVLNEMGLDPAADTGSIEGDLESAARTLSSAFAGPLGQALAGLVADMALDASLATTIRRQVLAARRKSMRDALQRAEARGEVQGGLDVERSTVQGQQAAVVFEFVALGVAAKVIVVVQHEDPGLAAHALQKEVCCR